MAILLKQGNLKFRGGKGQCTYLAGPRLFDQVLKNSPADCVACAVTLFVPVASCESRQTRKDS